jgi:hypothetical protein
MFSDCDVMRCRSVLHSDAGIGELFSKQHLLFMSQYQL